MSTRPVTSGDPERRHPSAVSEQVAVATSSRKTFNPPPTTIRGLKDFDSGRAAMAHRALIGG